MKNHLTKVGLLSLTILLVVACSKSEDETTINDFSGFYKIQSISSSLPIDLNNDGFKTNDYLHEIKSNYTTYNGEIVNYGYDNELTHNFAEARPLPYQSNNAKILDLRFPVQRIDSIFQGNNNFVKMNMEYERLITGFIYKLTTNNIEIESDPFNHFDYYNINNFEINRLSKEVFEINFDFHVYDFSDNEWNETRLKAKYIKITED